MSTNPTEPAPPGGHLRRIVVAAAAVAIFVALIVMAPVEAWLIGLAEWVDSAGRTGLVVFAMIYVLGTVVFVPASVLSLSAGFLFGLTIGLVLVGLCIPAGAFFAFVVGRHLAREAVQKKVTELPTFHALERAISREGFKMAFLTRLVPILPFTILNYIFGVTRVGTRRFMAATWLGMIPTTVAYVYVGAVAGDLKRALAMGETPGASTYVFWTVGVLAVIAIVWVVTTRARRELELLMEESGKNSVLVEDDVE